MDKTGKNTNLKIGFIGCGKMASAIIKGVLSSNFLKPENICASEINEEIAEAQKTELGIKVFPDNKTVVKSSDIIFLAIKPGCMKNILKEIKEDMSKEKLIVSIAAGISTKTIEDEINFEIPVIRVMPNTPAMILEGMSGISKGKFASDKQVEFIKEFLSKIGKCIIIEEDKIDILTAISGSGPAFFYKIINEIARAGERLGLEYEKSLLSSIQTAIGSAKLMLESGLSPEELIANTATKGGCTQEGVDFMDSANSKELFFQVIKKTAKKAKDLGN